MNVCALFVLATCFGCVMERPHNQAGHDKNIKKVVEDRHVVMDSREPWKQCGCILCIYVLKFTQQMSKVINLDYVSNY